MEWDIHANDLVFHQLVGKGAYGEVWKGKWNGRGGGETVAIKKINIWGVSERLREEIFSEVGIIINIIINIILIIGIILLLFDCGKRFFPN